MRKIGENNSQPVFQRLGQSIAGFQGLKVMEASWEEETVILVLISPSPSICSLLNPGKHKNLKQTNKNN